MGGAPERINPRDARRDRPARVKGRANRVLPRSMALFGRPTRSRLPGGVGDRYSGRVNFPFHLRFKILALAPQIHVTDGTGAPFFYVRQKLLKFKEDIGVFQDESQARQLFRIQADRVIDFTANYTFSTPEGAKVGRIKREGLKSLWAATYTLFDAADQPLYEIRQLNPWSAVLDRLLGEIPVVGLFTGMFLHPVYGVRPVGSKDVPCIRLVKKRSFLETGFEIVRDNDGVTDRDGALVLLAAIMITLLERSRG
jgi:hypothetical protein